jgi:SAM-dependent methyltransferase
MQKTHTEWFSEWFNSPYYHILYRNRDLKEAAAFVDTLAEYLQLKPEHHIMDLACGKGRHSIHLNQKGFRVTGVDLSEQNIKQASLYANARLSFERKDMRYLGYKGAFDFVLNLFTSFGYFDDEAENIKALNEVRKALKPGGRLVLDFLNPDWVVNKLVPAEEKEMEGIRFEISRREEAGFIVKDIRFEADGETRHFQERVRAISLDQFKGYFLAAGLELEEVFGNYALEPFHLNRSERMIFIVRKPLV